MNQISQVQLERNQLPQRFVNVETLSHFGSSFTHDEFLAELANQNENRKDFLFNPTDAQFTGTQFMIADQVFSLDMVSLITLAERFKVSGSHTITRTGLLELSYNPSLFEQTANYFLHRMKKPLQFRTLFDVGIAFPSKDYTKVNHFDFLTTVLTTLEEITDQKVMTEKHYLHKELMYCFIPIEGLSITFENAKGQQDTLQLGLECRNSEILQNAISVSFKIIRTSTQEGIILTDTTKQVYQRHIGMSTEEALLELRKDLISMFKEESLSNAVQTLEFIKKLLETHVTNGIKVAENFAKWLKLPTKEAEEFVKMAAFHSDSSLYGWTFAPYQHFVRLRTNNRQRIEQEERLLGTFLSNDKLKTEFLNE